MFGSRLSQAKGSVLIRFGQVFGELKFLRLATEHKGNLLVPSPPRLRLPSVTESVVLPPVSESHHAPHPTQPTQSAVTRPSDAGGHAPQGRGERTPAGFVARRQDQKSSPSCNRFPCERVAFVSRPASAAVRPPQLAASFGVLWWQTGVIYQIYPRSFQDTNADGIGDLKGIERRLDYLAGLGVDAIWISPIYPSPMADFGYDVTDYCDVDSRFGVLADFDSLLSQAHARGLKILLDFVPNHTSDRHPWFVESRASRDNPKRDWYIWRDPAPDGGPPNNWISDFGGSAWARDEATGQYYYHAFLKEQPDLNWRNPAVQAAMYDVMRFWLDRGVDGFRIDVLWHLIKAADFQDNPPNPDYRPGMGDMHRVRQLHSTDQPEVHEIAADMRAIADSYGASGWGERVLIGEIYLPVDRLLRYYGRERAEVHLPFNFQLIDAPWEARS